MQVFSKKNSISAENFHYNVCILNRLVCFQVFDFKYGLFMDLGNIEAREILRVLPNDANTTCSIYDGMKVECVLNEFVALIAR